MDYKCRYIRESTGSRTVRWFVLVSIIGNVLFNILYTRLIDAPDIAEVSKMFNDLFTPAGYVFSIWGLIYLSFIIYGIIQLLPSERNVIIYDRLSAPLIFVNILSSAWIVAFTSQEVILSFVIISVTLVLSIMLFARSCQVVEQQDFSRWLSVPFSLFCGWISVANIANASVTLVSLGWDGGPFGRETWAIVMVIVAGLLAAVVDFKFENFIYPLVIAWTFVGIWEERQHDYPTLASAALVASIVVVLVIIAFAVQRYFRSEKV